MGLSGGDNGGYSSLVLWFVICHTGTLTLSPSGLVVAVLCIISAKYICLLQGHCNALACTCHSTALVIKPHKLSALILLFLLHWCASPCRVNEKIDSFYRIILTDTNRQHTHRHNQRQMNEASRSVCVAGLFAGALEAKIMNQVGTKQKQRED